MAIQKQPISINFSQGLNTKIDPKQVPMTQFLSLNNGVFDTVGLLSKRNGFGSLTALPEPASYLTTFNGALAALGNTLQSYSPSSTPWVNVGDITPLSLDTLPIVRNSLNQTQCDMVVAPNGVVCAAYSEFNGISTVIKYTITDSTTGQAITPPSLLPVGSGTPTGSPRVFLLSQYFVIVFTNVITAVNHLQYVAISVSDPTVIKGNTDIASPYAPATSVSWDGVVYGSNLYIAYNTTTGGQAIKVTYLSQNQAASGSGPVTAVTFAGQIATMMSLSVDSGIPQSPKIYAFYYDSASKNGFVLAVDQNLNTLMTPTQVITTLDVGNITSLAAGGGSNSVCTIYFELLNNYSYDAALPTHYIRGNTVDIPMTVTTGTVGTAYTIVRSVGLASKAFVVNDVNYFLAEYQSQFQPTYFLIDATNSVQAAPIVVMKLAYQNGFFNSSGTTQGYLPTGLPGVSVINDTAQFGYLFKDLISSVNKENTGVTSTATNPIQTSNVYSQTGVNLAKVTFGTDLIDTAEIGNNLNISGGFLAAYDGTQITEQNFFLYPDNVEATWSATGGAIHAQPDGATNTSAYWYQVTYEWTDNQGNAQRSAPSIPIAVTTTGTGTAGSITVNVPYLRLTYKTKVKIVIYRWSVAQQVFFQITSITQPQLNSTTSDSLAYVDTLADASILGNSILYTTGGVIEDVNAPASDILALFDDRLWLVDSEDRNLLWFSKQVIEATPVEMSDLLTFFIAPTTGAQGSTGNITALSVMDDKLIIFKKDAIYYINGTGPDNTGSNNSYNGPVFITSTVGCSLQKSIVFTPNGLLFQSDKGIWLLGRDLSVSYLGAPVEKFTKTAVVNSALGIPGTNQVRFGMSSGITLMYDYFVGQWGSFVGIPGLSSTLYQGLHTFINQYGNVLQETPNVFLDNTTPVVMSFETGEFNLAGLQGYERIFFFYLLGKYLTPHKLNVQIAYDYADSPSEYVVITPNNFTPNYGGDSVYGESSPYGGPGDLEAWRIFTARQRCRSFRIAVNELYDPSFNTSAGAGLSFSGINAVIGIKSGFFPTPASESAGLA